MVTDRTNIAIGNKYKVAYGLSTGIVTFDLAWPILKVKIMYISIANILQIVTYGANIDIVNK